MQAENCPAPCTNHRNQISPESRLDTKYDWKSAESDPEVPSDASDTVREGLFRGEATMEVTSLKAGNIDDSVEKLKDIETSSNLTNDVVENAKSDGVTTGGLEITKVCSLARKAVEGANNNFTGIQSVEENSNSGAKVITVTPVDPSNIFSNDDRGAAEITDESGIDTVQKNKDGTSVFSRITYQMPSETLEFPQEQVPTGEPMLKEESKIAPVLNKVYPEVNGRSVQGDKFSPQENHKYLPNIETVAVEDEIIGGENRHLDLCHSPSRNLEANHENTIAAKVDLHRIAGVNLGEIEEGIHTGNVMKPLCNTGLQPLKPLQPLQQMNNQPTKLMSTQGIELDRVNSSITQEIGDALDLPIKRENTDGSCTVLDTLEVDFKEEPMETSEHLGFKEQRNSPLDGEPEQDCGDNKENVTQVEIVYRPIVQGKDMIAHAMELEFQANMEGNAQQRENGSEQVKGVKQKGPPESKKTLTVPKGKSINHSYYWKKYVVKKQRIRKSQGTRVKWRYVKVYGSKRDGKEGSCPMKSKSDPKGRKSTHHSDFTPIEMHQPPTIVVSRGNPDQTVEKIVRVHIEKIETCDQNSTFKFENAQLNDKEKDNSIWKCCTKKSIIESTATGHAYIGYMAECQLCNYTCDYFQGSSMKQMSEHLKQEHNIDVSKIRIDKKEEEMMQEKMTRLNLKSKAWNYFILRGDIDGEGPVSAVCILCGSGLSYDRKHSTSHMTRHLNFLHNDTKHSNRTVSKPNSKARMSSVEKLKEKICPNSKQVDSLSLVHSDMTEGTCNTKISNERPTIERSREGQRQDFTRNDVLDPEETELTREEKKIAVRKCFVKRKVKDGSDNESVHKVAVCQLCQFELKYECHRKPSLSRLATHLSEEHHIPLRKMVQNLKDSDFHIMKEKDEKNSYVWKYFHPKKETHGEKITSTECVLCAVNIPFPASQGSLYVKLLEHLQSAHRINLTSKSPKTNPELAEGLENRKQRMVSKCFVWRDITGENDPEMKGSVAECQLCECKIHLNRQSDITEMVEHLNEKHQVHAAKVNIDIEDEKAMKERIKEQRLTSVVWKFLILKEGNDGQKSSMCTLWGSYLVLNAYSSTTKMRIHLQTCHSMVVPSTVVVDNDKRRSQVSFL